MRRKASAWLCLWAALLLIAACAPATTVAPTSEPATEQSAAVRTVRVLTHDSFDISEDVLAAFEREYGAKVEILQAGDAGVVLNQAILSADNPLADVLYGVDNTLLSRALEADIFEVYESPRLAEIPDDLELDPEHRLLPVDYGDVCLNYDKGWFADQAIPAPTRLEDLIDPRYQGLTVVENPATSSPGLAFMLATIGHFGEEGETTWLDYWASLRDNGVLVVDGWEDAYWSEFTYGSGGEGKRPVVVSYASSPPVEVLFAERPFEEAPTAAVVENESCFRQIEFVGLLKGAQNRELAQAWIDAMLSVEFQEDIPLHMFVFPANQNAALPDVFARFAAIPSQPADVAYQAIEANREAWIQAWSDVVLR